MLTPALVITTTTPAQAFDPGTLTAVIPATVATAAVATNGAGVILGVGAALTAVPVAVAASGLVVGAAAGLAGTAAVKLLWNWASTTSASYADPAPAVVSTAPAGTWATGPSIPAGFFGRAGTARIVQSVAYNANGPAIVKIGVDIPGGTTAAKDVQLGYLCSDGFHGVMAGTVAAGATSAVLSADINATCTKITAVWAYMTSAAAYFVKWNITNGSPVTTTYAPGPAPGSTPVSTTPISTCQPASGAAHAVAGAVITYKRTDTTLPPILAPACPVGEPRVGFSTPSTGADGATVPSPLGDWAAPTLPSGFPECQPAGRCQLVLTRHAVDGSTLVCNGTSACTGWSRQPLLEPLRTVRDVADGTEVQTKVPTDPDGATYRCQWGPYELKASECTVVPTESPAPRPVTENDPAASSCLSGAVSWNPVDWVFVPVKCALQWAFVPPPGTWENNVATMRDAYKNTPPAVVTGAVSGLVTPFTDLQTAPSTVNCEGPTLTFPQVVANLAPVTLQPFNSCSPLVQRLLHDLAYGVGIYDLEALLMYVGALLAGARIIGGAFGTETAVPGPAQA